MMKKAVVIVAKDANKPVLDYYSDIPQGDVFFLSPQPCAKLHKNYPNIRFLSDNDVLDRSRYKNIERTERPNWYYQQFLKYSVIVMLNERFSYEIVHIIDGDSFMRKQHIFDETLFYTPRKVNDEYKKFITKTGLSINDDRNFISNQMCFRTEILMEMLKKIADNEDWIEYFLKILLEDKNAWLSEYQLYACYAVFYHHSKTAPIKVFRRLDLVNVSPRKALRKYFLVSNETGHETSLKLKLKTYFKYFVGKNLG